MRKSHIAIAKKYAEALGKGPNTARDLGETPRQWANRLAGQAIRSREVEAAAKRLKK
jgi:hypothetical protein